MKDSSSNLGGHDLAIDDSAGGVPEAVEPTASDDDRSHSSWLAALVSVVLTAAVVAPWTAGGWLLSLDWISGPGASLPRTFWGLDGAVNGSLGFTILATALMRTIGAPTGWVVIAAILVGSFCAVGVLAQGPSVRRVSAGLLYTVNPFVYDRLLAGQVALLAGYALLPLGVHLLLRGRASGRRRDLALAGLVVTTAVAFAPHFAWIFGLVALALLTRQWRHALRVAAPFGLAAVASMYLLAGFRAGSAIGVASAQSAAFPTRPLPVIGEVGALVILRGFWRAQPAPTVPGWPFFLLGIAIVVVIGLRAMSQADRPEGDRSLCRVLLVGGGLALALAIGDAPPVGGVHRTLVHHVPGFASMREPQKFLALTSLAYAVGFGFGIEQLRRRAASGGSRGPIALLAMLPVFATPLMFWGLAGQVRPATYPADWSSASSAMGDGDGRVLFLPWHQYLSFPFTSGVIANPAETYFDREVIAGDNVELQGAATLSGRPTSRYLEQLYERGPTLCAFGNLVAPLGVEYVALAKTVDWRRFAWLDHQTDLEPVFDGPTLRLYRSRSYAGVAWRAEAPAAPARLAVGAIIEQSRSEALAGRVVAAGPGAADPEAAGECSSTGSKPATGARRSSVEYDLPERSGGPWGVLSEPFDVGWAGDRRAVELGFGTVAVEAGDSSRLVFSPWRRVRGLYLLSVFGVVATVLLAWARRSR